MPPAPRSTPPEKITLASIGQAKKGCGTLRRPLCLANVESSDDDVLSRSTDQPAWDRPASLDEPRNCFTTGSPARRPPPKGTTPWDASCRRYPRALAALVTAILTAGVAVAQQATIVGTLEGHTDPVYAIAWSPDGKTLATASFDNTVRLWDAATRKEIKKYEGHSKLVLAVAIAPDGKHILSGSQDNTAKIWDYPDVRPVKTFAGHPGASRPWPSSPTANSSPQRPASRSRSGTWPPEPRSRISTDTPARSRARPGAVTAASSPPATKPTRSGSGKATSRPKRRSKHRRTACSAWLIFPTISSSFPPGRTGLPGSGSFRSPRRGGSRRRGRWRPSPSAATVPGWRPPAPTRSSASGTQPTAN